MHIKPRWEDERVELLVVMVFQGWVSFVHVGKRVWDLGSMSATVEGECTAIVFHSVVDIKLMGGVCCKLFGIRVGQGLCNDCNLKMVEMPCGFILHVT